MNEKTTSESEGDGDYPGEEIDERIERTIELYRAGDGKAALAECQAILSIGEIDPKRAARISRLLDTMGQTQAGTQVRERVLSRMAEEAEANPENLTIVRDAAMVFDYFDLEEEALVYFYRALKLKPGDLRPALRISHHHMSRNDPDAAIDAWKPVLESVDDPGKALLTLARALGQFNFREKAEEVLKRAEPLCEKRRNEFEFVAAGVRGETHDHDQHAMAVEIFDKFASSYDEVLKNLENRGPMMIGKTLEELKLQKSQSRSILDAGCGTGLCAPYLRPFAKSLAGADISTKMLDACREKGVYDTLTRTDLSVPATYPEGSFDLIVSSDVLVYFGSLDDVFKCVLSKLTPGGWFIFTVEKAPEPEPPAGYRLNASGRHVHSLNYINGVPYPPKNPNTNRRRKRSPSATN